MKTIHERIVEQKGAFLLRNGVHPKNMKLHQNLYVELKESLSSFAWAAEFDLKGDIKTYIGMNVEVINWNGNSIILY